MILKVHPRYRRVRLKNCPVGLFTYGATLVMMTQYSTGTSIQRDAYIVDTGEYFWGGCNGDAIARGNLLVNPCVVIKES